MNDGGVASYKSGSGTDVLTFSYTVAAGQNTASLSASAISLNGASITDKAGNPIGLPLSALTQTGPQIDTTPPIFTAIAETPSSGDLNQNKAVTFVLTPSEAVTVSGGTPTLTLNDGGVATYDAALSSPTSLAFDYTVLAGQNTASLAATKVNLGGATILDAAGNAANLSITSLTQTGPQIDTRAPTISAAAASASSTDLNAGKTAEITLTMSEAVTVTGAPELFLSDGGVATYDAALSSGPAVVFDYTVAAGQNTTTASPLKVSNVSLPVGASIDDLAGNAAVLTAPSTSLGLQIDTLTPSVTKAASSPATGTATTGTNVAITLTLNEAITLPGTPSLLLNDGGVATYNSANSKPTSLVFDYTVPANQGTAALQAVGLSLSTQGNIEDAAGNVANLQGAAAPLALKINSIATSAVSQTIGNAAQVELFGASGENATFAGTAGTLVLDNAQNYTGSVSGMTGSDTLDLASLAYGANMTVGYSQTGPGGGVLSVGNGTQTANIALLGNYLASSFTLSSDGHGGTSVVDPPKLMAAPMALTTKPV